MLYLMLNGVRLIRKGDFIAYDISMMVRHGTLTAHVTFGQNLLNSTTICLIILNIETQAIMLYSSDSGKILQLMEYILFSIALCSTP